MQRLTWRNKYILLFLETNAFFHYIFQLHIKIAQDLNGLMGSMKNIFESNEVGSSYGVPEPSYEAPASSYDTPSPSYDAPAPSYSYSPTPSYSPQPTYEEPEFYQPPTYPKQGIWDIFSILH